jgi:hypothetical protein
MSKIQIANLQPVGSELFQGGESFLAELQATEAHAIHGGTGYGKKKSKRRAKARAKARAKVVDMVLVNL